MLMCRRDTATHQRARAVEPRRLRQCGIEPLQPFEPGRIRRTTDASQHPGQNTQGDLLGRGAERGPVEIAVSFAVERRRPRQNIGRRPVERLPGARHPAGRIAKPPHRQPL